MSTRLLMLLVITIPFQEFISCHPVHGKDGYEKKKQSRLEVGNQTPTEDRKFKPPTFPYWGPFGLTGTALFCAYYVGPFAGPWNRACAGPVPPFQATTTTTTTPRPAMPGYPYNHPPPFPGPYPPPQGLSFPYDNSFYPLPGNILAINSRRRSTTVT